VASVRDVSERRAAEQALRQSEQRTRSILDNMLSGLITIDEGATIESVNAVAEAIFGYTAADLLANNCNLDRKNPRAKEAITHLPPDQLVVDILQKEQRIIEIVSGLERLLTNTRHG
jgi:PAS domain-containing protein